MSQWKLSIDTGGTFTDCFYESPDGALQRLKILSNSMLRGKVASQDSPDRFTISSAWNFDPSCLSGYLVKLLPGDTERIIRTISGQTMVVNEPVDLNELTHFEIYSEEEVPLFAARLLTGTLKDDELPPMDIRLGTTRGTNALLEKSGAGVTLLITKGFRDLLAIGNQQRPDLFALNVQKPPAFHEHVIEVKERLEASGEVLIDLTDEECYRVLQEIRQAGTSSVAIAFLHAYKNNVHEHKLARYLNENDISWISTSSTLSANSKLLHRAQTTVVNAYLSPVMNAYFHEIEGKTSGSLKVMTSAGHLSGIDRFAPKDGLLSGPAGGVKGAAITGRQCNVERMVTFDMGGTSTDVSIFDGTEDYAYETSVGGAVIQAPCLAIDTIAAGGGSKCYFDGEMLQVGPSSAGASPGPACYGAGGPLTVTDINLLSGRLNPGNFSIPVNADAAEQRLQELRDELENAGKDTDREALLRALLQLTTEKMARAIRHLAIRKGVDISALTLVTFGGAGGQFACDLAEELLMEEALVPYDAGLLSAHGIRNTEIAHFAEREFQSPWQAIKPRIDQIHTELFTEGKRQLEEEGHANIISKACFLYLRFKGQESTIEVAYGRDTDIEQQFKDNYRHVYGHWLEDHTLELTSVKVVAAVRQETSQPGSIPQETYEPEPSASQHILTDSGRAECGYFTWEELVPGTRIKGPAVVGSANCTVVVNDNWEFLTDSNNNARLRLTASSRKPMDVAGAVNLALFTNRFSAVVEEMGAILQRTSFSVNVKERVDFSCALLDAKGKLVVNAPHIPVHLGSMGVCVRSVAAHMELREGDVILTNHPAFGGSHLPDLTLISPVYHNDRLICYVANRAHHAEIGGKTPGSMPPDAKTLAEEGVLFEPVRLLHQGKADWDMIRDRLTRGKFPSRTPEENLADLRGALASINAGVRGMKKLCELYGENTIMRHMEELYDYAGDKAKHVIASLENGPYQASEILDDGKELKVNINRNADTLQVDFTGSPGVHPGNLNATPAIVRSVILYVIRLLLQENLPLNEGILRDVKTILPEGMLNPDFTCDPLPAVVGGNTEISQRLTDTLLKALGAAACSYGTMNNIIFGNNNFGFYETICGGTGAGQGFHGCDAVHQHMTNTRITDPEIIELRYPVRMEEFTIREGSGGAGEWHGGNGVVRAIRFLEEVELSVLTQHRVSGPYGMNGGKPGKPGNQYVIRDQEMISLASTDYLKIKPGDLFVIKTPGGGGWGHKK